MALGVCHDISFERKEHIRGVDNVTCDSLSRGATPIELGFSPQQIINTTEWLGTLLDACNPTGKDIGFEKSWRKAFGIALSLEQ